MSSPIRRVCFYGGPGVGKSTKAPRIFSRLKELGEDVDYIGEHVKKWVYRGIKPESYDEALLFMQQMNDEDTTLRYVQYVVAECPLLLCAAYAKFYNFLSYASLVELAHAFEKDFPSLNFYIERTVPYVQKGRYQDEKDAKVFDEFLLEFCKTHGVPLIPVNVNDTDTVIERIFQEFSPVAVK